MSKILAVSCFMPPLLTPRSLQVAPVLKHLRGFGWESTVLCIEPESWGDERHFLDPELGAMYRGSYQLIGIRSPQDHWPLLALGKLMSECRMRGARWLWDGQVLWMPPAIRAGRRLLAGNSDYSVIVSFAMPWSSHMVAHALWRASGLPWIAHFSDPWVDSPNFRGGRLARHLLGRVEELVIRNADLVLFTTERTAKLVMRKYPQEWWSKIRIIPHGYNADLLPSVAAEREPAAWLRLVYAGSSYGLRTPIGFLQALAELGRRSLQQGRVQAVFIGSNQPEYQRLSESLGLGNGVQFHGPRRYRETLKAISEADVCLVIDAPSAGESVFLPSKMVDYLMMRKPILGITPQRGESADLLRRIDCPVVAPEDVSAIVDALDGLLTAWQADSLVISPRYDRVASEYDVREVTRLFDTALREVRRGDGDP